MTHIKKAPNTNKGAKINIESNFNISFEKNFINDFCLEAEKVETLDPVPQTKEELMKACKGLTQTLVGRNTFLKNQAYGWK